MDYSLASRQVISWGVSQLTVQLLVLSPFLCHRQQGSHGVGGLGGVGGLAATLPRGPMAMVILSAFAAEPHSSSLVGAVRVASTQGERPMQART
eukprot:3960241-Pleurochrysis_carterae.AAC.1